jgi:hypothetical protein
MAERRKGERRQSSGEFMGPTQHVMMTSYDQWMRRLLLLVAAIQIFTALYAINRIDRNYNAGTGNREVNCAILREISKSDPNSIVVYNDNCR